MNSDTPSDEPVLGDPPPMPESVWTFAFAEAVAAERDDRLAELLPPDAPAQGDDELLQGDDLTDGDSSRWGDVTDVSESSEQEHDHDSFGGEAPGAPLGDTSG